MMVLIVRRNSLSVYSTYSISPSIQTKCLYVLRHLEKAVKVKTRRRDLSGASFTWRPHFLFAQEQDGQFRKRKCLKRESICVTVNHFGGDAIVSLCSVCVSFKQHF